MAQALNYPAAAARGFRRFIDSGRARDSKGRYKRDFDSCEKLYELLTHESCAHFQLPEGGSIFNDKLKGIQGKPIRLPYPLLTVSYHCQDLPQVSRTFDGSEMLYVPKRVVVAIELPRHEFHDSNNNFFPGCERFCMVMAILSKSEAWAPCGSLVVMPTDKWDGTGYLGAVDEVPTFVVDPVGSGFLGAVRVMLPTFFEDLCRSHGKEYAKRSLYHDIGGEALAVLELCEALTCTNVHEATIQQANPNVNARRERDGKLPLWETKVLTIDAPKRSAAKEWQGGHHATPRFHLCRGHMRGHPNGRDNIWIEDYARGDPAKGTISKTYRVRKKDHEQAVR